MKDKDHTTIRIAKETKEKLDKKGNKTESYDSIIERLLKN